MSALFLSIRYLLYHFFKLPYEQGVMPYAACRSLRSNFIKEQPFDNEVNVSLIQILLQVYLMPYTTVGMSDYSNWRSQDGFMTKTVCE